MGVVFTVVHYEEHLYPGYPGSQAALLVQIPAGQLCIGEP